MESRAGTAAPPSSRRQRDLSRLLSNKDDGESIVVDKKRRAWLSSGLLRLSPRLYYGSYCRAPTVCGTVEVG
ncbi:unnamed protein product [Calypogeia fissa]